MTKSQNKEILNYLKQGKAVTAIEALNLFGCFRLAARIKNLRDSGIQILDYWITDLRTKKRFKAYYLGDA